MHICILSDKFPPRNTSGGADRIAFEFAKQYVRKGHEVSVISTCQDGAHHGEMKYSGMSIYYLHTDYKHEFIKRKFRGYVGILNPVVVRKVRELLRKYDPDIIHSHNVHGYLSYYSFKIASDEGIPILLTFHDAMSFAYGQVHHFIDEIQNSEVSNLPKDIYSMSIGQLIKHAGISYTPFRNIFNRKLINDYVDYSVAVSDELRKALTANNIPCSETIHNGIDIKKIDNSSGTSFREDNHLKKARIILFGGRICRAKGGAKIARAFKKIAARFSDVVLVVTGKTNKYLDHMKSLAEPYNDRIIETGWLTEEALYNAYDAADVVVTPSIYLDPFPTRNLEAMAAATPVVATCFGGSKELVIDRQTGRVVNPINVKELSDAIIDILNHPEKQEFYGNQGFNRVSELFTLGQQCEKYLNIIDDVVQNDI